MQSRMSEWREREASNAALERAARHIEQMIAGRDPWLSGEVLALHNAVSACADIVRQHKR